MLYKNLSEVLTQTAKTYPHRTAIIFGRKKISYKSLDETTNRIAAGLLHMGLTRGGRVALFLDNCPEFIISYYAVLKAGGVVVPINYMFTIEEAKYILDDARAEFLITSRAYAELARELRVRVESLTYVIVSAKSHADLPDFSALKRDDIETVRKASAFPSDVAVILYTSGTTGHPKGAMLSHDNLISNARDCSRCLKIDCRDSFICILPLFHSFAATVCMNLPIFIGAAIVVMKSLRPFKRVVRAVRKNKVTIFVGIPAIYTVLKNMKIPRLFQSPLMKLFNPVRLCVSGAAALPVDTLKGFEKKLRIPLLEGYGLTEASPVVTINPPAGIRKPGSIGLPLSEYIQLAIVDEKGNRLQPGKTGELIVKGPNVMLGYLGQEEANRQALRNGWLFTGDMARFDKDGYVYIAGRKKEMVNVRGLNVYPREIEDVLYQNPKVKEAAVIGIPDQHKGEVPKGFVVLHDNCQATERELILHLRQHLAAYKIPKQIEFRKSLPKNTTGKILKRVLQDEERKV